MHEGFWFAMACAGIEFFLHQKTGPGLESTSFFPHGFHGSPPFCCSGFVVNFLEITQRFTPLKKGVS